MSIVYTPTEGDAIQNYSRLFRRPEGCYLNIEDPDHVEQNLAQWGNAEDIDYIVVSGQLCATTNCNKQLIDQQTEKKSSASVTKVLAVS